MGKVKIWEKIRHFFSRSEWAIRLLGLSRLRGPAGELGLILIQIDGLSLTQFNRALRKGNLPFLRQLIRKKNYVVHSLYSGLPSNTPAVQGELFYGIKGCVPAFHFVDRARAEAVKMFDASYVEQFEPRLKARGKGLLTGGSSYSNIYTGGAEETHFCFGKMGWSGIWHAIDPRIFPFLVILYIDIFVRTIALLVVEFFLALFAFLRGALQGRVLSKEMEMLWLRTLVCVVLREFIVAGVCMDIRRGLPIIHMNFLGYDEQAHCRGPSSAFAHWSLQGIDYAIERINNVGRESPYRRYEVWVYADHGQEKTTPYLVKYGRTVEEAVEQLFGSSVPLKTVHPRDREGTRVRAELLKRNYSPSSRPYPVLFPTEYSDVIVTAMGPLGHIYVKRALDPQELEFYAQKLVTEVKIPLVMTKAGPGKIRAWTPHGVFILPQEAAQVFGTDHPFLSEIPDDLLNICVHPDAGEFVIAGWSKGHEAISFPIEFGAHASMGPEETNGFALLPMDAPLVSNDKNYLRPLDLRQAVWNSLI